MKRTFIASCFAILMPLAYGDQGGFTNSGGSLSGGSAVTNPQGTLTISGNTLTFLAADGSTTVNATFSTSSTVESCSGGGKGGNVKCSYTFTGTFSGTLTARGFTQAINGSTYQIYGTNGVVVAGNTGYNSAYTPIYFTDGNARILRTDDLSGSNAIAYGTQGTGAGQFYGPSGIALDASGRLYITDTYNDRIVRVDDMNGTNWTTFGTYGTGAGQFTGPQSVSIDPAGHIWILDSSGRLIRMDDMNGTNWTTVGSAGSGVGQFGALSSAPGFDTLGRIYVADAGNRRVARFDDLNFTNWTTLSQSQPVGPYIYLFGGPIGVVTDPGGKIYVADGTNLVRVDDMTGLNWTSVSLGTFSPHTIAIDSSGMVVLGNGYNAQIVDSEGAVLTSNISGLVQGVYVSVYGAVPKSLPNPRPSAIRFTPPTLTFTQNTGAPSAAQTITLTNFGGSNINGLATSVGAPFSATNNCPAALVPAASCAISVTFTPQSSGSLSGTLSVTDDSYNLGPLQMLVLSGTGTDPAATVTPASLSFSSQVIGTSSKASNVTVQNSGTGPLQVSNVAVTGPFTQTNTCGASNAPGTSCSIAVVFSPTASGTASGVLTITDNAGTQTVTLTGNGSAPVNLSVTGLSFGTVTVGTTSAAKTVTVTNHQSTSLSFTNVSVSAPFGLASNTCGTSLAAGASCSVGVTFTPASAGAATGTLTFTDSAVGSPQTVSLSGTGSSSNAPVTLSTSSLNFGTVAVSKVSAPSTVTLTNRQSTALAISSIGMSGPFAISSNTCGTSLAAGAACAVAVTFAPTAPGTASGTLTFADNAANSPQTVSLSGIGSSSSATGALTLSPSPVTFNGYTIGDNPSKAVTVTNTSASAVGIAAIALSGDSSLTQKNNCGASLAAGGTCTITVTFRPVAYGTFTGTLTVAEASGAIDAASVAGVSVADN